MPSINTILERNQFVLRKNEELVEKNKEILLRSCEILWQLQQTAKDIISESEPKVIRSYPHAVSEIDTGEPTRNKDC